MSTATKTAEELEHDAQMEEYGRDFDRIIGLTPSDEPEQEAEAVDGENGAEPQGEAVAVETEDSETKAEPAGELGLTKEQYLRRGTQCVGRIADLQTQINRHDVLAEDTKMQIARIEATILSGVEGKNETERKANFAIAKAENETLKSLLIAEREMDILRSQYVVALERHRNNLSLYKAYLHGSE